MKKLSIKKAILPIYCSLFLSSFNYLSGADSIQFFTDVNGNSTAFWQEYKDGISSIRSSTQTKEGEWSMPFTLSTYAKCASQPMVAINESGMIAAIWVEANLTGQSYLYSAFSTEPGAWTAPSLISTTEEVIEDFRISINNLGTVTAIWSSGKLNMPKTLFTSIASLNGDWHTPHRLSSY